MASENETATSFISDVGRNRKENPLPPKGTAGKNVVREILPARDILRN
jgi:hypothetical protein